MATKKISSGPILRSALLLLGVIAIIFMPDPKQAVSMQTIADILETMVIPVLAPIVFVLLLMDIVIRSATSAETPPAQQRYMLATEGIVCIALLIVCLQFILTPVR